MSIEAIKEALKAGPTEGPWTVEVGESPSVAIANEVMLLAKTLGDNDDANALFIAACNPAAIRELIERLEAAEKDAERYRQLRDKASMGTVHIATPNGAIHYGSGADEAIDSAMAGGLAEGVSDA
jgi:uncharacterized protein YerC